MTKEFLKHLKETRRNYKKMVEFCTDNLLLNNSIVEELQKMGFDFDIFGGDIFEYYDQDGEIISYDEYQEKYNNGEEVNEEFIEFFQYYIIDPQGAQRFKEYTNETIIYNNNLDLYILCVSHYGTSWDYVPANWKDEEEEEEEEENNE